jgi:hypothetical protein
MSTKQKRFFSPNLLRFIHQQLAFLQAADKNEN